MRTIGVVTVGRSDFGILLPILRRILADSELRLHLIVGGAHLSSGHGHTIDDIIAAGIPVGARVQMLLADDSPESIAKSMGLGTLAFAQCYAHQPPDLLVALGDRYEMHSAVIAALPFRIPIAHIHGGEVTQGAIDEAFRHSITKCSHLHFASTQEHADRIVRLGEEPWRVRVSGAPSLDNLDALGRMSREELAATFDLPLQAAPLLVTYHPVTLQYHQVREQIDELLAALSEFDLPIVFTAPNADTNGRIIIDRIRDFVRSRPTARLVENLGTDAYFSMMRHAAAMVGNSSSGIIEAASFGLPVVNIGIRQAGRPFGKNVVATDNSRESIIAGVRRVLRPEFRDGLQGMTNIYGSGRAAATIVDALKSIAIDDHLLIKRFYDGASAAVGH